uniref:D-lactate dehydrogenase (cytochrome) n=1 Tax=Globisporangium ultimum (strain ATCC 200006 / CBS 805.95 / DAOM BR144) TaxID=431595 RepID=K3WJY6_GLOUD
MWTLRLAKRASSSPLALARQGAALWQNARHLSMRTATPETIAALKEVLGDRLSTANAIREQHGTDESYHAVAPPDAVAFVQSTEEVSKVIKICAAARTPVIPFGAGSSLEGHISATYGGVSIDLTGMNKILSVEPENMSCRVEAGVTREQLNVDLRATGLFFPVDPGANATLGGMISTNASGTTTVRYGNMKTNVMALTAVMPDGKIIKTGSKTRKSSAGYDLTRLLIGSEGTLGIVTEAELRLYGIPEAEKTMICSFPTIKNAVDTCAAVMQMGIPVARMELMDENAVQAINKYSKLNNPVRPSLIIEHHGSPGEVEEQSAIVQELATDFEAQDIELATSTDERKKLWSGRHSAWYATMSEMPGSRGLSTDVCVPMSRLADVIVETQEDLRNSKLFGTIVGHVGDGNFHVMIPFFNNNEALMAQVKKFSDRLVMRALRSEGTCTGEHGVGNGKMDYLQIEHGDSIGVMLAIKNAVDPLNIMNPGKIFFGNAHDASKTYGGAQN